jgi:hypothetical protein
MRKKNKKLTKCEHINGNARYEKAHRQKSVAGFFYPAMNH